MYAIEWKRKALKQLKRIEYEHQKQIVLAVRNLQQWPDCKDVKPLVNRSGYRLRVGRYRILFEVETQLQIIAIEEVKKRDDRTY